jgi:hypothetical protein
LLLLFMLLLLLLLLLWSSSSSSSQSAARINLIKKNQPTPPIRGKTNFARQFPR